MRIKFLLACAVSTLLFASQSFGEIVYQTNDATSNSNGFVQLIGNNTQELGNLVTLGGAGRTLTNVTSGGWVYYGGYGTTSPGQNYVASMDVSFYTDSNLDGIP